jgi:hypothetical protein
MFIARANRAEVRLIFLGLKFLKASKVKVRTDFGVSKPIAISASNVAQSETSGTDILTSFSTVDPTLLLTAYLRGMTSLIASQDPAAPVPEVLTILSDLERILLTSSSLPSLVEKFRYRGQALLPSSIATAADVFNQMLTLLGFGFGACDSDFHLHS